MKHGAVLWKPQEEFKSIIRGNLLSNYILPMHMLVKLKAQVIQSVV